jgi:Raf kinase inhibitor-like YbhB/YbcL family protein
MAEQKLTLTSPSFAEGGPISVGNTCDGSDLSPQLEWINPPQGTRSFALIVDDPDAPSGLFTHWVIFDIPAAAGNLAEGQQGLGMAGRNDFQKVGYNGPCPPPRHGKHRYNFTLFALDVESLNLSAGATRQEVENAMQGHILHQTQLTGLYERK